MRSALRLATLLAVQANAVAACGGRERDGEPGPPTDATIDGASDEASGDAATRWDLGLDASDSGCGPYPTHYEEGAPCPSVGLVCHPPSALSCPTTATCKESGWYLECPLHFWGTEVGTCGCAHPRG